MVALLAPILLRFGIPARLHRIAAIAVTCAAVALIAAMAWRLWLGGHDRRIIAADRAPASLASANADATANANDTGRTIDQARRLDANERAIANAEATHPAEVRNPAGRSVNALADELRARGAKAGAAAGK